jgi:MFS family permease
MPSIEIPANRNKAVITVAVGIAQTLAWASSYYLPAILAAPIAGDLKLESSWVFGAFSCALLVSALLGPIAGRAIDSRGGRNVLMLSNVVFAIGLGGLGLANGPVSLILAWLMIGAGMATGLYDAAFGTLAGLFGGGARGSITGITLMAGFASTIGWPLTSLLNTQLGWREACFVWAGAHLLLGLPLHRWLVPLAAGHRPVKANAPQGEGNISPLLLGLLSYVFAAGWFVSTAMAAHLPRLLQDGGASLKTAIIAGALIGPAQVVARLIEFSFLQRTHPLASARFAVVLHPLGALLFGVFGAPAAVFAVLHGAGNGLLTIAVGTLPLALFGPVGYGLRQGLIGAPSRVAQAASPLVFGLLMDRLGVASLTVTSGMLAVALVALIVIGRLARKTPAE